MECSHKSTRGRNDENGDWCDDCGIKIYDVEENECQFCIFAKEIPHHSWICTKYLMGITKNMRVTFKIIDGTCFTPK